MRRTVGALGLAALVLVLAACAASNEPEAAPRPPAQAAEPQQLALGWRESHPDRAADRMIFEVESLEVSERGWSARVAVSNRTSIAFDVETGPAVYGFGLMLFPTGSLEEVKKANAEGRLPAVREATRIEPSPPPVLQPGTTWRATLTAPGSLADGSWVRVVFGTFLGRGDPPEEFSRVVWFTDRAVQL
jgi:hypothetical protein